MSILDLHADIRERNALSFAANPGPAPEPSFSLWATLASGAKAVPAGLLEGAAAVRDVSHAVDMRTMQDQRARAQRLGIPFDESRWFVMPGGTGLRKSADEFMPDPLTAHAATRVVAGFSKSLTKAGASMLALGPVAGAGAFGLAEADDAAQRLQEKGVDRGTAWQVGGVVGAVSALGAGLPVSGAAMASTVGGKIAATAGLATVGGPLSFMAQEGLSREILQRANYADEAATHDPLDPIGLAASMFPFVIGGLSVRGAIKRMPAVKTEGDMKAAVALTPAEQAHSDAFERSAGNLADLKAAVDAEKRPEAKAILQAELDAQTRAAAGEVRSTAAARAAEDPAAIDAARVAVLDETVARSLPDAPGANAEMLKAADMVGAGERVEVYPWDEPQPPRALPTPAAAADELRFLAAGSGWAQEGGSIIRSGISEPGDQSMGGRVVGRTTWIPREQWYAEMRADLGSFGLSKPADIAAAVEKAIAGQPLKARESRTVEWLQRQVQQMRDTLADSLWKLDDAEQTAREAFDAGLTARDAPDLALTARAAEINPDAVERAAIQYENDDAAFMAEMRRIVGNDNQQAPDSRADAGQGGAAARPAPREPGTNTLPDPGQAGLKPEAAPAGADAAPPGEPSIIQRLAEQDPQRPVRMPGDERNTTLAAALERIQAEKQADMQMADLVQVAVQCALTGGAAT